MDTSDRLKQLMSEHHLKQVDVLNMSKPFQRALGISMGKSTLSQYVSGKQSPDQERLFLLAKTFDVSEPWLMGYNVSRKRNAQEYQHLSEDDLNKLIDVYNQLEMGRQQKVISYASLQLKDQEDPIELSEQSNVVYVYGAVSAGTGEYVPDELGEPEAVEVSGKIPKYDYAVRVNGDSMEPTFDNGQILFVKKVADQNNVRNNQFVIADFNGELFVKKLSIKDKEIKLISLNKKYKDIIIHDYDDFVVEGTVII